MNSQRYHYIENVLSTYRPDGKAEKTAVDTIQKLLSSPVDLLDNKTSIGHFTGSGLVIHVPSQRFLLHLHKKLNLWLQFGGHADGEGDLSKVALRETIEETGLPDLQWYPDQLNPTPLDIDAHIIPARSDMPEHYHLDFRYLLTTNSPEGTFHEHTSESTQFRWFLFSEVSNLAPTMDPSLLRLVKKADRLLNA